MGPHKQRTRGVNVPARNSTIEQILASNDQLNRTSADFLKVDLETALTFSGIALENKDVKYAEEKRRRNQFNARRGYDTILHLMKKLPLTERDAEFVGRNLQRLKLELQELGETF
jgi:hypothetical protein